EEDEATLARHRRIEQKRTVIEPFRLRFDAQRAAPEGMTPDVAGGHDLRAAREPEAPAQVAFLGSHRGEQLTALLDLDHALAALPLRAARGGDGNADGLGALEKGLSDARLGRDAVDRDRPGRGAYGRAHDAAAPSAPGAGAPPASRPPTRPR